MYIYIYQVLFISSIPKRESLVYFKSRGVPTTASVAILTECTSPPLFSLLPSAWQGNSGARRGAETWNRRDARLEINETWLISSKLYWHVELSDDVKRNMGSKENFRVFSLIKLYRKSWQVDLKINFKEKSFWYLR